MKNEKITELGIKSGLISEEYSSFDRTYLRYEEKRFAEEIIQECASVVENLSPGYNDYRNQIEDAFRRDCVEKIKQHFGV